MSRGFALSGLDRIFGKPRAPLLRRCALGYLISLLRSCRGMRQNVQTPGSGILPLLNPAGSPKASPACGLSLPKSGNPSSDRLDSYLPLLRSFLPARGNFLPTLGKILPARGEILPARGDILPARGDIFPARGNIIPARGNFLPARRIFFPARAGESAARADKTAARAASTSARALALGARNQKSSLGISAFCQRPTGEDGRLWPRTPGLPC